jgi:predicted negative regulator of RcsB-dependent stress response
MDEEITIIDSNTRKEKIKNFFINYKKKIIIFISVILILLIGYFSFEEIKNRNKIKLANQFNSTIEDFKTGNKEKIISNLTKIINEQDTTYSPLALYFLIDNNLIDEQDEINNLFNILIDKTNLEKEIKNLIIYKKALFNSNFVDENKLMKLLSPILNSESIWKSHGLYLIAEYFYSKNEKQKAKEFFNKILMLTNSNNDIKLKSQKRISRDYSE